MHRKSSKKSECLRFWTQNFLFNFGIYLLPQSTRIEQDNKPTNIPIDTVIVKISINLFNELICKVKFSSSFKPNCYNLLNIYHENIFLQ